MMLIESFGRPAPFGEAKRGGVPLCGTITCKFKKFARGALKKEAMPLFLEEGILLPFPLR